MKRVFTLVEVFLLPCVDYKKAAFTLAEVLITLGIIGVVAAMTMPTLMSNHQKEVWVNQLKKTVSVVSQGILLAKADSDFSSFKNTNLYTLMKNEAPIEDVTQEAKKYFNIIDSCKGDCQLTCNRLDGSAGCAYGPPIWTNSDEDIYTFYLKDGSVIGFYIASHHYNGIMDIVLDVNSKKGPNKYGRDIFRLALNEQEKVVPWDTSASGDGYKSGPDGEWCGFHNSDHGWCCVERIIADGWKMNY